MDNMIPQLAEKWAELEAERKAFWQIIEQATPQQRMFKPTNEAWCMLEVAQHIIASEKGTLDFLQKRPPIKPSSWFGKIKSAARAFMLKTFLKSRLKFKAPNVPGLSPQSISAKEDSQAAWEQVRQGLEAYLIAFKPEQLNYIVFKHPVGGKFNLLQTLDNFLLMHLQHHKQQLKRIAETDGFPAA